MREIKFRGKRESNGEWVYGDLRQENSGRKVIMTNLSTWGDNPDDVEPYGEYITVDPNTVGQFTGLLDKNGREIYEGDILLLGSNKTPYKYEVGWNNVISSFCIRLLYEKRFGVKPLGEWLFTEPMNVIGNIHDNPELLNTK